MRKRLANLRGNHILAGSATLLINTAVLSLLGAAFWAVAAHLYKSSSIGVYSGINSAATLLGTVAALGFPLTIVRFLPHDRDQRGLVGLMIATVLLLGTAIVVILDLVAGSALFRVLHIPHGSGNQIIALVLVIVTATGAVTDAGLVTQRSTMMILVKNVIGSTVRLVSLWPLAAAGTTGLVIAATGGTVLAAVLSGGFLWRGASAGRQEAELARLWEYVRYSVKGYVGVIFGILPLTLVPLIVLAVGGPTEAGWFAIVGMVASLLGVIPSTTAQVLFAEGSRDRAGLRAGTITAAKAIYSLLIPTVLAIVVLAPYIMDVFGPQYRAHATTCLRIMAIGGLFLGATYVIDSLLAAIDRMHGYMAINILNSLMVVGFVAIAVSSGINAVAIGWASAQAVSVLIGLAILVGPRFYRALRLRTRAVVPDS